MIRNHHQGNKHASKLSDMRPFTIALFAFTQLSATVGITRDQRITRIQTGTMSRTFISLTSTIRIAYYQPCEPGKFKGGIGEGGEIFCLLKLTPNPKEKPDFGPSSRPCRSYRNEALIPQAKRIHEKISSGIKEQKTEKVEDSLNE